MSALDDQLRELQGRKLKVEFFKLLRKSIGDVTEARFKEVEKEVKDQIFAFVDAQVDMIESGEITKKSEITGVFSDEQFKALSLLADKVANKTNISNPYGENEARKSTQKPKYPQDKVSFALQHRNLENKEVKVRSLGEAKGKIVGLDAPNVVVQLLTGQTVEVSLGDIII